MNKPSQSVDAPRQPKIMTSTANVTSDIDLDFLNLKEVAAILRLAPISIYRLVAKRALPVYRTCRKVLFKRKDVLDYLKDHRKDSRYGSPKT